MLRYRTAWSTSAGLGALRMVDSPLLRRGGLVDVLSGMMFSVHRTVPNALIIFVEIVLKHVIYRIVLGTRALLAPASRAW